MDKEITRPVKWVIDIMGDWYHGELTIYDTDLKGMTHQFTSMSKWYGQACIIEPKEYEHWVFNEDAECFMTYDEYDKFKKDLYEIQKPYFSRNAQWADNEGLEDIFEL